MTGGGSVEAAASGRERAFRSEARAFLHFVGGEWVPSASGRTFEKRRPSNAAVIGRGGGRCRRRRRARGARRAWARLSVGERSALLRRLADEIRRRHDDFVEAERNDTGRPKSLVAHGFVPRAAADDLSVGGKTAAERGQTVPTSKTRRQRQRRERRWP